MAEAHGIGSSRVTAAFMRKVVTVVAVSGVIVVLALMAWKVVNILLLVFAAVLLAIVLRAPTEWIARRTRFSEGQALGIVTIVLLATVLAVGWLLAPSIAHQVDQLSERLPQSIDRLRESVTQYAWGRSLLGEAGEATEELKEDKGTIVRTATDVFGITARVVVGIVLAGFLGLYLAAESRSYQRGLLYLVPRQRRARAEQILNAVGYTLRWWMLGQMVSMATLGVLTAIGLYLLDVPLALTLALITALLTFIPNFGPVLSYVPPALLALMDSPQKLLYVTILYVAVQNLEGYLITPMVQRRVVRLPPAVTLVSQVLMYVLVGALGFILATPLAAAMMVAVKMIYMEDTLGERMDVAGAEHGGTGAPVSEKAA